MMMDTSPPSLTCSSASSSSQASSSSHSFDEDNNTTLASCLGGGGASSSCCAKAMVSNKAPHQRAAATRATPSSLSASPLCSFDAKGDQRQEHEDEDENAADCNNINNDHNNKNDHQVMIYLFLEAAKKGHWYPMERMLQRGLVSVNDTYNPSNGGDGDGVDLFASSSSLATCASSSSNGWSSTCWTALHYACHYGHLELVQNLLDQGGASLDVRRTNGETPLHTAAKKSHDAIVKILLAHKSERHDDDDDMFLLVNAQARHNQCTALHYATARGHLATVRALVEQGHADLMIADHRGETPLHLARRLWGEEHELCDFLATARALQQHERREERRLQQQQQQQQQQARQETTLECTTSICASNNNNHNNLGGKAGTGKHYNETKTTLALLKVTEPTPPPPPPRSRASSYASSSSCPSSCLDDSSTDDDDTAMATAALARATAAVVANVDDYKNNKGNKDSTFDEEESAPSKAAAQIKTNTSSNCPPPPAMILATAAARDQTDNKDNQKKKSRERERMLHRLVKQLAEERCKNQQQALQLGELEQRHAEVTRLCDQVVAHQAQEMELLQAQNQVLLATLHDRQDELHRLYEKLDTRNSTATRLAELGVDPHGCLAQENAALTQTVAQQARDIRKLQQVIQDQDAEKVRLQEQAQEWQQQRMPAPERQALEEELAKVKNELRQCREQVNEVGDARRNIAVPNQKAAQPEETNHSEGSRREPEDKPPKGRTEPCQAHRRAQLEALKQLGHEALLKQHCGQQQQQQQQEWTHQEGLNQHLQRDFHVLTEFKKEELIPFDATVTKSQANKSRDSILASARQQSFADTWQFQDCGTTDDLDYSLAIYKSSASDRNNLSTTKQ